MLALVKFGATNWTLLARMNIDTLVTSSEALFSQKARPALVAMAFLISAMTAVPSANAQGGDIELRAGFIHRKTPYAVDGLALGEKVIFGSKVYSQYKCDPSQLFQGATWCVRKQAEVGPHGQFNSSTSILHNPDGYRRLCIEVHRTCCVRLKRGKFGNRAAYGQIWCSPNRQGITKAARIAQRHYCGVGRHQSGPH